MKLFYCLSALLVFSWWIGPAQAERRAFVVGISDYTFMPPELDLKSPEADAKAVALQLKKFNFRTTLVKDSDTSRVALLKAWAKFVKSINRGDEIVLYFSGHGVAVNGANYFVPKDANPDKIDKNTDPKNAFLSFRTLIADLDKTAPKVATWIIDACRNNELEIGQSHGLAKDDPPAGNIVLYAAEAGKAAIDRLPWDDKSVSNSLYTRILLPTMRKYSTADIDTLAKIVQVEVSKRAQPEVQRPAYYSNIVDYWCLTECSLNSLLYASYVSSQGQVSRPTVYALASTKSFVRSNIRENVVFLGRKSAARDCGFRISEKYPFGCVILKTLASNSDVAKKGLIGKSIRSTTGVNVRQSAPVVLKSGAKKLGCITEELLPNSLLKISGIFTLVYEQDDFYWGTVAGVRKGCATRLPTLAKKG